MIVNAWSEVTIDCIKNGFRKAMICDYTELDTSDTNTDTGNDSSSDEVPDQLNAILEEFEAQSDEDFDGFD